MVPTKVTRTSEIARAPEVASDVGSAVTRLIEVAP
jgi:hypothetical protein